MGRGGLVGGPIFLAADGWVRGKPAASLERARSAGLGRTQASSRASYGKRGLPDGASVRGARVGREARGCPVCGALTVPTTPRA